MNCDRHNNALLQVTGEPGTLCCIAGCLVTSGDAPTKSKVRGQNASAVNVGAKQAGGASDLEAKMAQDLALLGLAPEREYKFNDGRQWKADFAFPAERVIVECEGGVWSQGRHTRGSGFIEDCVKYNAAAIAGWCVLRYTAAEVEDGTAACQVAAVVKERGEG